MLYEDTHLLALEKPSGLLTSIDRCDPARPNLMKLLHDGIAGQKPWAVERGLSYLSNAHRLDSEASGVLLLARSKETLIQLADLLGSEKVSRKYVALVQGSPVEDTFQVDSKLAPHPKTPQLMHVDRKRGKKSTTRFSTLEKFARWTLLRCEVFPDRAHQVRVHLRSIGLPIVGDGLYGGKPLLLSKLKPDYRGKPGDPEQPLVQRLALHLDELSFQHPSTGENVVINSPSPKVFEVGLKYLRRYASS